MRTCRTFVTWSRCVARLGGLMPPARLRGGTEGLRGAEVPAGRAVRGRARESRVRRAGRSAHLLRRDRVRRRLEVDRRRAHLEADLRRPADEQSIGSHRGRAVAIRTSSTSAPARRTFAATSRRARASSRATDARQDLEARLEAGRPDRHDGRASDERGHRLRRGARPRVRAERRARRLSHHGRRQDLGAGALQGRRDRRERTSASIRTIRASSSPGFWQTRRRPWEMTSGGPGSGPVRLPRRRRHLGIAANREPKSEDDEAKAERPARRALGQGRRRGRAVELAARLRPDRSREGRPVPLRRRRRDLDARQRHATDPPAGVVLLDAHRPSDEPRRRLRAERAAA